MSGKNKKQSEASGSSLNSQPSVDAPAADKDTQACSLKHWIGLKVQDESGDKVTDVRVRVKQPDGNVLSLDLSQETLEADGTYRTQKVLPAGNCEISFPEIYNLEWWPQGGNAGKASANQSATAQEGDCVLRIANTLKFRDYHSIWDQAPNKNLSRPNPNQLNINDVVAAPDEKDKVVSKAVDKVWVLVLKNQKPAMMQIKITDRDGNALSGMKWKLFKPVAVDGTTGNDGLIKLDDIPADEVSGSLEVTLREASKPPDPAIRPATADPPPYPPPIFPDDYTAKPRLHEELKAEWDLKAGSMPSFNTKEGVLARLRNLGFGGDVDADDQKLQKLVKAYQRFYLKAKTPSGSHADIQADIRDRHDKK
jgi:hypothetical protein